MPQGVIANSHRGARDRYREWDWHKRKQWVLVMVPVSGLCEYFYMIDLLYSLFSPYTSPRLIPMQCEYTISQDSSVADYYRSVKEAIKVHNRRFMFTVLCQFLVGGFTIDEQNTLKLFIENHLHSHPKWYTIKLKASAPKPTSLLT